MKTLRNLLTVSFVALILTSAAAAADLTGNWKWTFQSSAGPSQTTAKIAQKGDEITGTVTGRQGPADIANAVLKDGVISFSVTRTAGAQTMVIKYEGKFDGDTITGSIERPGPDGKPVKTEWHASRAP